MSGFLLLPFAFGGADFAVRESTTRVPSTDYYLWGFEFAGGSLVLLLIRAVRPMSTL
jgi:hypothetical protein